MKMTRVVTLAEARAGLIPFSRRAEAGEVLICTHHGRPRAVLIGYAEYRRLAAPAAGRAKTRQGVAAVVLAATGRGRAIPGRGKDASSVVAVLRAAGIRNIVVVTDKNSPAPVVPPRAAGEIVLLPTGNLNPGFASSLKRGLRFLLGAEAAVIAFASQPGIRPATIKALLARHRAAPPACAAFLPTYRGRRGHPLLIRRQLWPAILRMDPRHGLVAVLRKYRTALREVPVADPRILKASKRRDG